MSPAPPASQNHLPRKNQLMRSQSVSASCTRTESIGPEEIVVNTMKTKKAASCTDRRNLSRQM